MISSMLYKTKDRPVIYTTEAKLNIFHQCMIKTFRQNIFWYFKGFLAPADFAKEELV